jgi:phosphoglycolate phosphatase
MKTTNAALCAILFDLDGTLLDTAPDIVEAANRMLLDAGAPPLPFKIVSGFIGRGVPHLVRCVLEAGELKSSIDEQHARSVFVHHYREVNGRFSRVFPGVREGLSALRRAGYRLACVTSKPLELAQAILALNDLAGYFEVVVGGDSVARIKPDPEPLLHACRQMRVDPASCMMVGDSNVDVAAARAAGMPVYVVRYGYPGPDGYAGMQCDALIESLDELPALLGRARVDYPTLEQNIKGG